MTSVSFQIGDPNEQQIQDYWKLLLSINPDNNPYNGVFYMRASYNYVHAVDDQSHAQRVNLSGSNANSVGTQDKPVQISSKVPVFVAVLDTIAHDKYLNQSGTPLTINEMNKMLDKENEVISQGDVRANIENLTTGAGPVSIVPAIKILSSPSASNATFRLAIPTGSKLAAKLEFPLPEGITVNARAAGLYELISNISPGKYHITNFSLGVRAYKAFMDYYIEVI